MTGVLGLLKPPGPTSFDMVAMVRSVTGQRRVGHAGTLDPEAAGVLPVCIGTATRLADYLHIPPKTYVFHLVLGLRTDTDDLTGKLLEETDAATVSLSDLEGVLPRFTGWLEQSVPHFSARKHHGDRLFRYARRRESVPQPLTRVCVESWELIAWRAAGRRSIALCRVRCTSGTYVRSLCRDIGLALGVGAVMGPLVRVMAGGITASSCLTPEEVEQAASAGTLSHVVLSPSEALRFLPGVVLDPAEVTRLQHGVCPGPRRAGQDDTAGVVRLLNTADSLLGIAERSVDGTVARFRLQRVLMESGKTG